MKPKTIWLKEETYQRLDQLREKRETFDQVVNRLCVVYETSWENPKFLQKEVKKW